MRSIRMQLTLTIMLVVLFTVTFISLFSNQLINYEFEKYMTEQQALKADNIVANLEGLYYPGMGGWDVSFIHGIGMYALSDGYIVKIYDQNGGMVWDAENHNMAMCTRMMSGIIENMKLRRPGHEGEFISRDYELLMNGKRIGIVTVDYYGPYFLRENDFNYIDTLNLVLTIIGLLSLTLSLIIGGVLARRIARPITKTAYIAKQISEGNYDIRFEEEAKSKEVAELAASVNSLAIGLDAQENLRKRLTMDVAHELRTPLTTVGSYLETMIEGVWEPSVERLKSCYDEIGRLSGLVTDLVHLSKTEGDNLNLNRTEVNLMVILCSCCERFGAEMKKKNISYTIEGDPSIIVADQDKIRQVMVNLISNAVKYTLEYGSIRMEVRDFREESVFIIEDNGIGIPKDELSLVFERFYRTDQSRSRKTGGAGIGLAIVKAIVNRHGGTIRAENCEKSGSRFIVALPKKYIL